MQCAATRAMMSARPVARPPLTHDDADAAPRERGRLAPVPRQKLADLAYDAMGERLVETRLAADLIMSRAPVREALRRLLEEGLVVERAHHGMFVRTFES